MANPQCENGYTKIANEILEALSRAKLNGSEFRIMMHLLRKTYGYNRKEYTASLSKIGQDIGMNRISVKQTMDKLLVKRLTGVSQSANTPSTYWINKDYDAWVLVNPLTPAVSQSANSFVSQSANSSAVLPIVVKKKKKKKINKRKPAPKTSILKSYDYPPWLNKKLWQEFVDMRAKSKHPITSETGITRLVNSLKKIMDDGYDQEEIIGLALERNWRGFFAPSENNSTGNLSKAEKKRREEICVRLGVA